jgi:hypothetical protein
MPPDLSQFTTDDLLAIKQGNLGGVSTAGLQALKRMQVEAQVAAGPGKLEKVGMGAMDPIHGGAQLLTHVLPEGMVQAGNRVNNWLADKTGIVARIPEGGVDQMVQEREAAYQARRLAAGETGFDGWRTVGNAVSPANIPAARLVAGAGGVGSLAARGAAAGGAAATLQPVTSPNADFGSEKATQVAAGAATGAVLTPVIAKAVTGLAQKVSEVVARFRPKSPAEANTAAVTLVDEWIAEQTRTGATQGFDLSQIPQPILQRVQQQVADALKVGKTIDPGALLRAADFESVGIKPTLGQLTRDATQYARELNLRGVNGAGEPLTQRFAEQTAGLGRNLRTLGGGPAQEAYPAGNAMITALRNADAPVEANVTSLYTAARNAVGAGQNLNPTGLAQRYGQVLENFGPENIPGAVRSRLEAFGLTGGQQTKALTVEEAERLLKTINAVYDPANKVQARALNELRAGVQGAIDDLAEQGNTIGTEAAKAFGAARAAARARFQTLEKTPALKAALDGTDPDTFVRKFVLGGKADELNAMAKVLAENPDALATARNQVIGYLESKAFGANAAGDKGFAQEAFNRAIKDLGTNRLAAFFAPDEIAQLQAVGRVGAYMNSRPAGAAVNEPNTASAVMNLLSGMSGKVGALPLLNMGRDSFRTFAAERTAQQALTPQLAAEVAKLPAGKVNRLAALSAYAGGAAGASAGGGK